MFQSFYEMFLRFIFYITDFLELMFQSLYEMLWCNQ